MSANMQAYRDKLEGALNEDKPWTIVLAQIEAKTGVKRIYSFFGIVVFVALYLVFGYGAQLICNGIGFLYPAYCSMKAVESPNKEDDTRWLIYWVVFAFFSLCEFFSDLMIGWFPFYWLIKCLFLVWCFAPIQGNGSIFIYTKIIRPRFLEHEKDVDDLLNKAGRAASSASKRVIADVLTKDE
ncbi:receptor expression-enhancing protein 5-like isoform X1 [Ischnura elegans]|uniref:receptor expression-enhancing protein 5-like isoform X1 n=1 Tax=Ischnura elegans TaxID=197161 RepID=UPI001ED89C1A|nr:receptor expression-enhancing protein 5-like isoform X1 [Ischnura elegans]